MNRELNYEFEIDCGRHDPILDDIDQWCKENCTGYWNYGIDSGFYDFTCYVFEEATDAMAFKLRWLKWNQ